MSDQDSKELQQAWSCDEQTILLDAMSESQSLVAIVESITRQTGRSRRSVENRLRKWDFCTPPGRRSGERRALYDKPVSVTGPAVNILEST